MKSVSIFVYFCCFQRVFCFNGNQVCWIEVYWVHSQTQRCLVVFSKSLELVVVGRILKCFFLIMLDGLLGTSYLGQLQSGCQCFRLQAYDLTSSLVVVRSVCCLEFSSKCNVSSQRLEPKPSRSFELSEEEGRGSHRIRFFYQLVQCQLE